MKCSKMSETLTTVYKFKFYARPGVYVYAIYIWTYIYVPIIVARALDLIREFDDRHETGKMYLIANLS